MVLEIEKVETSDAGEYELLIKNDKGETRTKCMLNISGLLGEILQS